MAIKPSPDRSDLESKSREDLQTIAKVKGVEASARASKASLIEAIMGEPPVSASSVATASKSDVEQPTNSSATRAVRSRRTVATPSDDFEDLLGEFAADSKADKAPDAETTAAEPAADKPAPRQYNQPRPERQPREFSNDSNNRSRRNRRNRNTSGNPNSGGRERFSGDSMANADQPYAGELVDVEGLLDLRDDGYGFLRTKSYHSSPNDVYVSINQVRRYHLRKGDTIVGGFRPAASNEKYPALLRVDTVAGVDPEWRACARALKT